MEIDWWTLALQLVNFLVLVWILARFLYRPVAAIVEKRRAAAKKMLDDVEDARAGVEAERRQIASVREGFAAEQKKIIADARDKAQVQSKTMIEDAEREVARIRSDAKAAIAHDRIAFEHELITRAGELSVDIARKLLERMPQDLIADIFLKGLTRQIDFLDETKRNRLAADAQSSAPLEVISAAELTEAQKDQCKAAIQKSLGASGSIRFRHDPNLIGGFEIHSASMVVHNNWQNDLVNILKDLTHDDRPVKAH